MKRSHTVLLLSTLLASACQGAGQPELDAPARVIGWKHLATWTGRTSMQTETFMSDNGSFRIRWETKNESPAGGGTLKVAFRSGDSGRVIIDAVDQKGVGRGASEVGDMVRWYYLSIDAADIDWSVTVEEPIMGHTAGS